MIHEFCPDGATDEEHFGMLEQLGQCPWCGEETEDYEAMLDAWHARYGHEED